MEKTKLVIVIILVFAFGMTVGLMTGVSVFKKTPGNLAKTSEQDAKACWEKSKQRMAEFGLIASPNSFNQEMKSVYGTIESISGNNIYLKIKPLDIFSDPNLDNRIIAFDASTKVYRLEKIEGVAPTNMSPSSDTSNSEASSSSSGGDLENLKNKNNTEAPKFDYQSKEIKIEDINAGDMISVLSDSNIRDAKNIQAKGITLIPAIVQ